MKNKKSIDPYFNSDKFLNIDYWEIMWRVRQFYYAKDNGQEEAIEKIFKEQRDNM